MKALSYLCIGTYQHVSLTDSFFIAYIVREVWSVVLRSQIFIYIHNLVKSLLVVSVNTNALDSRILNTLRHWNTYDFFRSLVREVKHVYFRFFDIIGTLLN